MTASIGPGGHLKLVSTEVGPERDVKVLSFRGRADTGVIEHPMFKTAQPPVAIINVNTGIDQTAAFSGTTVGAISQSDTGVGDLSDNMFFAFVSDTGSPTP